MPHENIWSDINATPILSHISVLTWCRYSWKDCLLNRVCNRFLISQLIATNTTNKYQFVLSKHFHPVIQPFLVELFVICSWKFSSQACDLSFHWAQVLELLFLSLDILAHTPEFLFKRFSYCKKTFPVIFFTSTFNITLFLLKINRCIFCDSSWARSLCTMNTSWEISRWGRGEKTSSRDRSKSTSIYNLSAAKREAPKLSCYVVSF